MVPRPSAVAAGLLICASSTDAFSGWVGPTNAIRAATVAGRGRARIRMRASPSEVSRSVSKFPHTRTNLEILAHGPVSRSPGCRPGTIIPSSWVPQEHYVFGLPVSPLLPSLLA